MTYPDYLLNAGLIALTVLGVFALIWCIPEIDTDKRYLWIVLPTIGVITFAVSTLAFRMVQL